MNSYPCIECGDQTYSKDHPCNMCTSTAALCSPPPKAPGQTVTSVSSISDNDGTTLAIKGPGYTCNCYVGFTANSVASLRANAAASRQEAAARIIHAERLEAAAVFLENNRGWRVLGE